MMIVFLVFLSPGKKKLKKYEVAVTYVYQQTLSLEVPIDNLSPWSPSGVFMVQKMAITSPIPVF